VQALTVVEHSYDGVFVPSSDRHVVVEPHVPSWYSFEVLECGFIVSRF
jgi:hypothetical protein